MQLLQSIKTRYRFIHFTRDVDETWQCRNNNQTDPPMGTIGWYPQWKRYIFSQNGPEFVFSADCLRDIADFMEQLPKPDEVPDNNLPF